MRNDIDTTYFKDKLETELHEVENELKRLGRKNPNTEGLGLTDWETKSPDFDIDSADENIVADKMEEMEENNAVLQELEIRYNEVKEALNKVGTDRFGVCEVCGENIEKERLEANPAAKTCSKHMN